VIFNSNYAKEYLRVLWKTVRITIVLVQKLLCMLLYAMRCEVVTRKENLKSYLGKT